MSAIVRETFEAITRVSAVTKALEFIEYDHRQAVLDQKAIAAIEAPTFAEGRRAAHYADCLLQLGLCNVHTDRHGNVVGTLRGRGNGPTVLVEAHLDTVFPLGTDVTPIERDGKIFAPGICDDARGLATLLSVLRAFRASGLETAGSVIFAGTVEEEGLGGMGGMRRLLEDHPEIHAAVSIDGAGHDSVIYEATAIRNYEVTFTGPGGHSYVAYGVPSPLHAAARAVAKLSDLQPPLAPKTTFAVTLMGGGHQVHAIAEKASFTINMRSDSQVALDQLKEQAIACFIAGAREENARWGVDAVTVEYNLILNVPAGTQPADSVIVQAAWVATECIGITPRLAQGGCTNTNVPVSMGIPAVTLGRGGKEGGIHSLGEWFDPAEAYLSPQKTLLLLLGLAGVAGVTEPLIGPRKPGLLGVQPCVGR